MSISGISSSFPSYNLPPSGVLNSALVSDHVKVLDFHYLDSIVKMKLNLPMDDFSSRLTHIHKIVEAKVFEQDESEFIVEQLKDAEKLFSEISNTYDPSQDQKNGWATRLSEINENISNVVDNYDHYRPVGYKADWSPLEGDVRRTTREQLIHGTLHVNGDKKYVLNRPDLTPMSSSPAAAKTDDIYKERLSKFKFKDINISSNRVNNIFNDVELNKVDRKRQMKLGGHIYLLTEQVEKDISRIKYLKVNEQVVFGMEKYLPKGSEASTTGKTKEELYERGIRFLNDRDPKVKERILLLIAQGFGGFLQNDKEFNSQPPRNPNEPYHENIYALEQRGGYSVSVIEAGDKVKAEIEYDYVVTQNSVEDLASTKAVISLELFRNELATGKFVKSTGKITFNPIQRLNPDQKV
ncbi:MAG: hypothetical protein WC222_10115 [Parachlamydiales bacterium]|jgi:hypothetical protein